MNVDIRRGERPRLDETGAELITRAIDRRLREAPHVVLGVVGGRSVGGIYSHLRRRDLPWHRLHVFLADERLVPVTSEESNWKLITADLLADTPLPSSGAHPFPFNPETSDAGISIYDGALAKLGGRFDIAILSAGEDGHTASLFPDHASIASDVDGFVLVEGSPKPPPRRVSASRRLLERSGLGVLVFYGESKRSAFDLFSAEDTSVRQCPSRVVTTMQSGVVLTDLA